MKKILAVVAWFVVILSLLLDLTLCKRCCSYFTFLKRFSITITKNFCCISILIFVQFFSLSPVSKAIRKVANNTERTNTPTHWCHRICLSICLSVCLPLNSNSPLIDYFYPCFLVLEYDTTLFKGCRIPKAPSASNTLNVTETPTPKYHDLKMTGCIDYFHNEVKL